MRHEQPHLRAAAFRTGARKRILIVDSNESNRRRLEECLSTEYEIRSVASPADSEALIRRFRPNLVIEQIEDAPEPSADSLAVAGECEGLVGSCDAMRAVFSIARRVARTDVGVLIVGECGTGKEATARAIHRLSARRAKAFVTLNVAALPVERLEAVIFGRENGQSAALPGVVEQADGGTLFLDGAGRIPAGFQGSLLEFLKEGKYRRVDGHRAISADVRLIAAADHPLAADVECERLRERLFYRLGVVTMELPPLRERGEDIGALARSLLGRYSKELERKIGGFTQGAVRAMMNHDWPGNITEMESRVRRAVIVARGRSVTAGDMGLDGERTAAGRTLSEARDALEHEIVVRALTHSVGNVSRAARSIGVSRPTMYDLIRKYGLEVSGFKAPTDV